jgi:hypothetical protein
MVVGLWGRLVLSAAPWWCFGTRGASFGDSGVVEVVGGYYHERATSAVLSGDSLHQ